MLIACVGPLAGLGLAGAITTVKQEKHDLVTKLASLQTAVNAMTPGAEKTSVQAALQAAILAAARANACGPLRVGIELPAAS